MNKLTPQKKRKFNACVRGGIQLLVFAFMPSAFTTAFAGVKYIFTQVGKSETIEFNSFVKILAVLLVYTIVFGRFFCGYACAFGSLGDAIRAIYIKACGKLKKKPFTIDEKIRKVLAYTKYAVLVIILIVSFKGMNSKLKGTSAWDVFSMLRAGNTKIGEYVVGTIALLLIVIGMAVCERFFCRFLCPMGAVFSFMPVFPPFSLRRKRSECINGCSGCKRVCPSDIELSDTTSIEISGECFQCGKCVDVCPKQNIGRTLLPQSFELCFTIVRAVLLAAVLVWAGL